MAPLAKSLAIAVTAFAALGAAAPGHAHKHHHKRGEEVTVWKTVTETVWTTIDVTTTIMPGQEAPPSTIVQSTVEEATAPAEAAPEPETTTSTSTSTSAAEPTSTAEPVAPTADANVQAAAQPTTTTVSEAPVPTTTTLVPAPIVAVETSSEAPEPVATSSASSGSSSGSSGSSGPCSASSPCVGQITFYDTATSASAPSSCGTTNDGSSENVIALPVGIMTDSDCGRTVTIKYGGKTATGTVVDKCMGCDNTSIDLSRHFFGELASFDAGRVSGVEWWLD
ncbi:uncharacterized protein BDW70DRAFT_158062 [Aspergillus foveolatus]|uniref:uncharacterized protein n=1 Tax=Aspergillus foveolatus TaxID=210207 RepID=UPI003CCCE6F2